MSIEQEVKTAIEEAIPSSQVTVAGAEGHFSIQVISAEFEGKRILAKQRMVYSAIKHLMAGDAAPVHAVDRLVCETP